MKNKTMRMKTKMRMINIREGIGVRVLLLMAMMVLVLTPLTAQAAVSASSAEEVLSINVIKYDPYPAEPGSSVDVWIRVENIGSVDASNIKIQAYPKYPFTLMDDGVKFAGTILKGQQVDYKYTFNVAEDAVYGTNEISIGYINSCLLYTSDAADEEDSVDLGGR